MDAPATSQREPTKPVRSCGFSVTTYLLSFGIAVILYALSPGPVLKFIWITKRPMPAFLIAAYEPIFFSCISFPAVGRLYSWYLQDLWRIN